MANIFNQVELLKSGDSIEVQDLVRGEWLQNLWVTSDSTRVRPGWGVVAELDTTLGLNLSATAFGYEEHLGSFPILTTFGHRQVVSVFTGKTSPSSMGGEETQAKWADLTFVRIYDLETDKHYEEVLYGQTSDNIGSSSLEMSEWYGHYETNKTYNNSNFISSTNDPFFFEYFDGYLYFGNKVVGVYVYRPADFRDLRRQQLEDSDTAEYFSGYSESSLICSMSLVDGEFADNFRYLRNSEIGVIVDIAQIAGRLVYITERSIYFSDPYRPNAIIALNNVTIPTGSSLTTCVSLRENIVIYSDSEMFLFTPSMGSLPSKGRLIKVSEHVGCLGPSSITKAENTLFWVSKTGIYTTQNGIQSRELSSSIRNFFTGLDDVTSPLTSYFETLQTAGSEGFASLSTEHPRTLLKFNPNDVSIAYSVEEKTLLVCFGAINHIWCFKRGWSLWPLESMVSVTGGNIPQVGSVKNLTNPFVSECLGDFYLTTGLDSIQITDAGTTQFEKQGATGVAINPTTRSYTLSKLGRGGALDRSSKNEDYRILARKYVGTLLGGTDPSGDARMDEGILYIRPARKVVFASGVEGFYIPVEFVPRAVTTGPSYNAYDITLKYDRTNFISSVNPLDPAAAVTSTLFPPERRDTAPRVTVTNTNAAGVADPAGHYLRFQFAVGAGSAVKLNYKQSNPLFEFLLLRNSTASTSSFGIETATALPSFTDTGATARSVQNIFTFAPVTADDSVRMINNAKAQPVDWAFKSKKVDAPGMLVRARGLFARLSSQGATASTDGQLSSGWLWGVYNILLGSDRKGYTTQIIDTNQGLDVPNITFIRDKQNIRTRFQNSAGNLVARIFASANGPKYGLEANPAAGDYLVDDKEWDEIATSDSVKGEELAYMVFGFMRGRADSLVLDTLKANVQQLGKRRRTGR